jgi:hypothetical protein
MAGAATRKRLAPVHLGTPGDGLLLGDLLRFIEGTFRTRHSSTDMPMWFHVRFAVLLAATALLLSGCALFGCGGAATNGAAAGGCYAGTRF